MSKSKTPVTRIPLGTRNDRSCVTQTSVKGDKKPSNVVLGSNPLIVRTIETKTFTDVEKFLWESLNVLLELSSFFGLKLSPWDSKRIRLNSLSHWMKLLPEENMANALSLAKYKAAAFFSAHKGIELPNFPFKLTETTPQDNPKFLLGGKFRTFQRHLQLKHPDRFDSYLASVSIGWKKGCPRPDEEVVAAGVSKTFKILTTSEEKKSACWADQKENNILFDEDDMKEEIRRTVRELFHQHPCPNPMADPKPFMPSTSANYINSRSQLGAIGYFLKEDQSKLGHYDLSSVPRSPLQALDGQGKVLDGVVLNEHKGNAVFGRFLDRIRTSALKEPPNVKLVGLAESFKVRVISKGPPETSTYLKLIQRWLWKTLKSTKTFQLIGTPVTHAIVNDRIGALHPGEMFASVDYSSATDLLYSRYSDYVAQCIIEESHMDTETAQLFRRLLTEHFIEDPETGELIPQKRGQLMGSIVSFPILCILNATVCRTCIEIDRNHGQYIPFQEIADTWSKPKEDLKKIIILTLDQCPLLINGDDALMRVSLVGYNAWLYISGFVGFSPSIGKTFFTDMFCQINSVNFTYVEKFEYEDQTTLKVRTSRFRRVEYVNMGLLYGKTRSSNGSAPIADSSSTIGSRMRAVVGEAPEYTRDRLCANFLARNKSTLIKAKLPWFLPENVGGLGLVGTPSIDDYIYYCWAVRNLPSIPASKRPAALSEPAAWQMRLLARNHCRKWKIPERLLSEREQQLSLEAQTWISNMLIFDPEIQSDPSLIYKDVTSIGSIQSAIRRNEKFIGRWKGWAVKRAKDINQTFYPLTGRDEENPGYKIALGPSDVDAVARTVDLKPKIDYALFLSASISPFEVGASTTRRSWHSFPSSTFKTGLSMRDQQYVYGTEFRDFFEIDGNRIADRSDWESRDSTNA